MKCDTENRIKRAAEERYAHFLSTKQESLKLKDALDGYFEEGSPYRHAYAQYLTRRRGPAADALAQKLQADQLRQRMLWHKSCRQISCGSWWKTAC